MLNNFRRGEHAVVDGDFIDFAFEAGVIVGASPDEELLEIIAKRRIRLRRKLRT